VASAKQEKSMDMPEGKEAVMSLFVICGFSLGKQVLSPITDTKIRAYGGMHDKTSFKVSG
jgi:hypothetical protein